MLDGGTLHCVEIDEPASASVEALATWIEQHTGTIRSNRDVKPYRDVTSDLALS